MSADIFNFPMAQVERAPARPDIGASYEARIRIGRASPPMVIKGDTDLNLVEMRWCGDILNLTTQQADEIAAALTRAAVIALGES